MSASADDTSIKATLVPRPARRLVAAFCIGGLAVLFASVAIHQMAVEPGSAAMFTAFAVFAAYGLVRFWKNSNVTLYLTDAQLEDSEGRSLARVSEIKSVSRGTFAFKPAHGFVLTLKSRQGFAWVPGVWWRIGRKVGVGGTSAPAEARFMAELIDQSLNSR